LGAILVGITSVIAALTLLPAVLQLIGDGVNRLRVPVLGRQIDNPSNESRFWGGVVRRVIARPAVSLILGAAVLLVFAAPVFGLNIGAAGISTLPDDLPSKQGFVALDKSFRGSASAEPATIVVDGAIASAQVQGGIARLEERLQMDPRFGRPSLQVNPAGDLAALNVPLVGDALGDQAVAAVRQLRSDLIPAAFEDTEAK